MVKRIKIISIAVFILIGLIFIRKIFSANLSSVRDFQELMKGYGIFGPFMLTLIQAFQVVVPVIPGYLGCAVGAVSFGAVTGLSVIISG